MAEIFLYTPDANINSTHLVALRKAGFIPVKVTTMDAVKIMPLPQAIPQATLDIILAAMCDTVAANPESVVAKQVGPAIAKRLKRLAQATPLSAPDAGGR